MSGEKEIPVHASSGNVFADPGRPDAEEALARARLAQQIAEIIDRQALSKTEAAALMELDQPKVSALARGRLASFIASGFHQRVKPPAGEPALGAGRAVAAFGAFLGARGAINP